MTETYYGRPFTRRIALFAITALAIFMAVACGGGGTKQPSGKLAPNQQLRIRIDGDPSTFDPQLASFDPEISVAKQLYRGLFTYDDNLNVVPAIATELPTKDNGGISSDGLTYTIKLRDDATWSDGKSVTAQDFVYAFQRLFDPDAGAAGYYYTFYNAIKGATAYSSGEGAASHIGVTAKDEHTLVIQLEHVQPTLATLLALWPASPLRQDVIDQYGADWTQPGHMITDGPFVLKEYTPNSQIVLDSNTNYWGDDAPTLKEMVYRIIPDDSAALIAYQNGEIDMTSIPTADSARFEGASDQVRFGQLETYALQYNHSVKPFDNKLVRQAFSRAIDRAAYVKAVQGGVGVPTTSWLPPGLPGVTADIGKDLDFDTRAAKELLAKAGYPDGSGFPKVTLTIVNDESNSLTAQFLKEQLKQNLGVDIEIELVEEATFYDRYQQGDFQLTWSSWFADYADPEDWLPAQFGTGGGFNVLHYSNPQVDKLLEQASAELDQSKRLAIYNDVHKLIIEDQAVTPVFNPERNYLVKRNVGGLNVTALDAEPGDWFATSVQIMQGAAPPASHPSE